MYIDYYIPTVIGLLTKDLLLYNKFVNIYNSNMSILYIIFLF